MKRKVLIVFANGSKEMAHNTDDLRLRWHERKLARAAEIEDELYAGIPLPIFDFPQDRDEALIYQTELKEMRLALMQRADVALNNKVPNHIYQALVRGRMQLEAKLGLVNKKVKEFNVAAMNNNIAAKQSRQVKATESKHINYQHELISAQAEIIRLQRLLIDQFSVAETIVYGEEA